MKKEAFEKGSTSTLLNYEQTKKLPKLVILVFVFKNAIPKCVSSFLGEL